MKITFALRDDIAKSCTEEIKRMAQEQADKDISDRTAKRYLVECISNMLNYGREYTAYPEDLVGDHYVPF
jgi:hypothetical protein